MRESGGKARFELYDVYNPSYRHGGKLNVTRMGYWNDEGGIRNELTQYKYKRRGNLNEMYLNFSIVVSVRKCKRIHLGCMFNMRYIY